MKCLIVDDDFVNRKLLQSILRKFGDCDIAANGGEAIQAFQAALDGHAPYDLVTLDIMMPDMDGQQVLAEMRRMESDRDIGGLKGVKVIMVTGLGDAENIMSAFNRQCEGYIIKPIDRGKVVHQLKELGLQ